MEGQQQLRGGAIRWELTDLRGALPNGVMPSRFYALQQGTGLLFLKPLPYGTKELPAAVRRVVRLLLDHGKNPDGPGDVTVVCFQPVRVTTRRVRWFDHTGLSDVEVGVDDFRSSLAGWFSQNRRHR